jgi:hypothetical protein
LEGWEVEVTLKAFRSSLHWPQRVFNAIAARAQVTFSIITAMNSVATFARRAGELETARADAN